MGNKERAREFKRSEDAKARRAEDEATLQRIQTQPRLVTEDVHLWQSPTTRRLQLIVLPSFEDGRAWEIREARQGDWQLFGSDVVEMGPIQVKGWRQLSVESATLERFHERITSIHLPIGPPTESFAGADGTIVQLAAFQEYAEWRFQWWDYYPPGWKPLVDVAEEMLEAFHAADAWPIEPHAK